MWHTDAPPDLRLRLDEQLAWVRRNVARAGDLPQVPAAALKALARARLVGWDELPVLERVARGEAVGAEEIAAVAELPARAFRRAVEREVHDAGWSVSEPEADGPGSGPDFVARSWSAWCRIAVQTPDLHGEGPLRAAAAALARPAQDEHERPPFVVVPDTTDPALVDARRGVVTVSTLQQRLVPDAPSGLWPLGLLLCLVAVAACVWAASWAVRGWMDGGTHADQIGEGIVFLGAGRLGYWPLAYAYALLDGVWSARRWHRRFTVAR